MAATMTSFAKPALFVAKPAAVARTRLVAVRTQAVSMPSKADVVKAGHAVALVAGLALSARCLVQPAEHIAATYLAGPAVTTGKGKAAVVVATVAPAAAALILRSAALVGAVLALLVWKARASLSQQSLALLSGAGIATAALHWAGRAAVAPGNLALATTVGVPLALGLFFAWRAAQA